MLSVLEVAQTKKEPLPGTKRPNVVVAEGEYLGMGSRYGRQLSELHLVRVFIGEVRPHAWLLLDEHGIPPGCAVELAD